MAKASINRFFIIYTLMMMAANFIHPVTPALFFSLGLADYMFGVAFACMALTRFLFCPFWGHLSDNYGRAKIMVIGIIGYAVGQGMFMMSYDSTTIIISRLFGGFFTGAYIVAGIAYIADVSTEKTLGKNISYYTALMTISSSVGFLIGGVLGDVSIPLAFIAQIIILLTCAIAFHLFLGDINGFKGDKIKVSILAKSINPLTSFSRAKNILNASLITFFFIVFLTSFASFNYENSFTYYISDQFGFSGTANGVVKAVMGMVGLGANLTVNQWLSSHTDLRKSIITVLSLCSGSLFMVLFMNDITWFIIANIIFYAFNTIYLPMQQTLLSRGNKDATNGVLSGLFTSAKSIGMIAGALTAGFAYTFNSKLPFVLASITFLVSAGISVFNYYQYKNKDSLNSIDN